MRAVGAIVRGRVQGVGYRAWTEQQATALGLDGWVRNRRDGTVEAQIVGPDAGVDMLLTRLHQGPPGSRVEAVEVTVAQTMAQPGFHVLPTV